MTVGWLRELCPVDRSAEEIGDLLALKGAHVESIERPWAGLSGVIVARVIDVRDHPSSDKLCLARLQTGAGEQEVVVGVRNMSAGDLVPYAPPGSRVPVLPEPLAVREVRGVRSNGMLCSPRELNISADHSGILILQGLEPGTDVRAALGLDDVVLDLEIESNRPDLLSVVGVARELAGVTGTPLQAPDVTVGETEEEASTAASVEIKDAEGCPRYLARVTRGVGGGRTPLRDQARLTVCGMRPISPVVDATNYVMLELGQPLHAFDLDRLEGPGIVVRRSEPGERLTTLDGIERELADDLLICDRERPVAIAGVMGAALSEVGPETRDVLLESAYFEPRSVLRTSRRLQLLTEASVRFSRGTDPEGVGNAAARAARLMVDWSGGEVLRGAIDAGAAPARHAIDLRPSRATAVLGYAVSASEAVEALETIGIGAEATGYAVHVDIPSFRPDIQIEADVIEEIVRVQGYDRLPSTVPGIRGSGGEQESYRLRRRVRDLLVRTGVREAPSLSFASPADIELMRHDRPVRVANPPSAEEPLLRTSLIPKLLEAVRRNDDRGAQSVALFEVGHVFHLGDPIDEREHVAFVLAGQVGEGLHAEDRPYDVLDVKGIVELLLGGLGVAWGLDVPAGPPFHPGRSAFVTVGDRRAGVLGEVHPREAARLDLPGRVGLAELDVSALGAHPAPAGRFREVSRFPPVRRDLAFVVAEEVPAAAVQAALDAAAGELLDRSLLFDVFRGGVIPEGRKSLAFALAFRAADRTLTDEEVEPVVAGIVERLRSELGAALRT